MSSLKEKAFEVVTVLTKVKQAPWNYIQPVDPYLEEAQQTWKMTFPWEFFGSLELHYCMSQKQVESYIFHLSTQRGHNWPPLRRSPTVASVISYLN